MARIFLSHAHVDKSRVRRISEALREAGHIPWLDEDQIIAGDSIPKSIEEGLRNADYVLFCLSQGTAGRPWVKNEVEVVLAQEHREGRERLLCIRLDDVALPYLLSARAAVDAFPDEQDLAQGIAEIIRSIEIRQSRPAQPPRAPHPHPRGASHGSGPHQLRAPPADFTGRDSVLTELVEKVSSEGVTSLNLFGPGGIGKTALALKLSEALTPHFPDGQIDLDLRGVAQEGQTPLPPAAIMTHVIRSIEPGADIPEDLRSLAGKYRSALHGRRVLLLLDNVGEGALVEPLLPPAGCCLLLTSRQNFTLPGMSRVRVDVLPPGEAECLLLRIVPNLAPSLTRTLAELCGYLPLALRLAASTLARHVDLDPAEYLERLRTRQGRLELVQASLDLSYELADGDLQQCWRQLGVFPADFEREAAAAVAGLSQDVAREALSELVRLSMLEYDTKARRYRLHDLSRLYAVSRLAPVEQHVAEYRHALCFESIAARIGDLHGSPGRSLLEGMQVLSREWLNVQAGQAWASANSRDDEAAAALCIEYVNDGLRFLTTYLSPEIVRWLEDGIRAARRLRQYRTEVSLLIHLAFLSGVPGKVHDIQQALPGACGMEDLHQLTRTVLAVKEPDRPSAHEYLQQALNLAQVAGDRDLEARALLAIGTLFAISGDSHRASEYYIKARARATASGKRTVEVQALLACVGLGTINLINEQLVRESEERAMELARESDDRELKQAILLSQATRQLFNPRGEPSRALGYLEQGVALSREADDRLGELTFLGQETHLHRQRKDLRRLIQVLERQILLLRELGFKRAECSTLCDAANTHLSMGEKQRASEYCEQALALTKEVGDRRLESTALDTAGRLRMFSGDVLGGLELMNEARRLSTDAERQSVSGSELTEMLRNSKFDFTFMKDFGRYLPGAMSSDEAVTPSFLKRFASPLESQSGERYPERAAALHAFLQLSEGAVLPSAEGRTLATARSGELQRLSHFPQQRNSAFKRAWARVVQFVRGGPGRT